MINLYAEAKMTHFLKEFLESAMKRKYVYSFLDDIEVLSVLNSFKLGQQRLKGGEVQFHHQQLVTLARYYYYHYHNDDMNKKENRDEVRKLMLEWVDTFIRAVSNFSGTEIHSWCIDRFMNGSYRIPHFDNTFPFDSIITEAIMKGQLQEKLNYPNPKELIVLNSKGEEKIYNDDDAERFWQRQYAELCATAQNMIKSAFESTKTKQAKEKIEGFINSLRDAVFILGISYAQQSEESKSVHNPKEDEGIRECFEFKTDLIRRSFSCFSTVENLNIFKNSEGFGKYIRKYEFVRGSGYEYIFISPDEENEKLPEIELPRFSDLDNGLRIGDDDGFLYGLKMSQLTGLMNCSIGNKAVNPDCTKKTVGKKGKKEFVETIKHNPDGSYNIVCDDLVGEVEKAMKYYYSSYVFRMMFAWRTVFGDKHWNFTESLRKGKMLTDELIQELKQFADGLNDRVKKVSNNDKKDTDEPTKIQSYAIDVKNLIKDFSEIGDATDREMLIASKSEVLKSRLISLIKSLWKKGASNHQALMKEHMVEQGYDAGMEKQLKSFIDSLQKKFVPALLLSENYREASADLFARLAMMSRFINDDGCEAVDKSHIIWNPNAHLCYEKDDTFKNELLKEEFQS